MQNRCNKKQGRASARFLVTEIHPAGNPWISTAISTGSFSDPQVYDNASKIGLGDMPSGGKGVRFSMMRMGSSNTPASNVIIRTSLAALSSGSYWCFSMLLSQSSAEFVEYTNRTRLSSTPVVSLECRRLFANLVYSLRNIYRDFSSRAAKDRDEKWQKVMLMSSYCKRRSRRQGNNIAAEVGVDSRSENDISTSSSLIRSALPMMRKVLKV